MHETGAEGSGGSQENSSDVHRRRYRRFRNHLVPRSRLGRCLLLLFLGFFLLTEWPVLPLANRIEPSFLGFPFLFVYLLVVYTALIGTLIAAALLHTDS